jgi:RNA polymerase sigma-70 factor (ECF subfamily)
VVSQSDQNETLLVLLTQEGDVAAFEELLRRLYGPLRQYVTRLVRESDADDVLQDAAIRIYKNIRFLREPAVFKAWAFRIATRIALTYLKRDKRWRQLENDPDLIRAISAGRSSEHEQFDRDYLEWIDRVSPASRTALLLHYEQHLSLEETAAILDIPVGTVKSRLSYGLASIRNQLKENSKP